VYVSDARWGAKIVTSGTAAPWYNYGSYVDIVGFEVSAPYAAQGIISMGSYVRILGNHVYSVALHTTSGPGAGINHANYSSSHNEVSGNRVSNIGPSGNTQVQGIYVSQTGAVVRNNVVNRVSGWCLHAWHAATNITVANNTVFNCGTPGVSGGGIVAGAGDSPGGVSFSDSTISGNVVRDSADGIRLTGDVGPGVRIVNNTVIGAP
jgi:hypothetical protein